MTDTYLIEEVINYEQRFTYEGKGKFWLKVVRTNFFEDEPGDLPPIVLGYTGNTTDNPTLTEGQVRPPVGYYTSSSSLVENREAKASPIKKCGMVPSRWDFNDQSADIISRSKYSNSQLINELINLPSNATVDTKIRGYGGLINKTAIGALTIREGVVPHISSIFECHYQLVVIEPTSKPFVANGFTEVDIKCHAQMITKEDGSDEAYGSQLALEWFVRVLPNGTNTILTPREIFELNKPK